MFSLKKTTYKNMLIGYWLLIPACFYLYLFMTSGMKQIPATDLIASIPGITLAFLIASLMLTQSVILYFIQQRSGSSTGLLGHYLLFSIIQQILTLNMIGACICFFYRRSLVYEKETISFPQKLLFGIVYVLLTFFTLLILFITWRMKGA